MFPNFTVLNRIGKIYNTLIVNISHYYAIPHKVLHRIDYSQVSDYNPADPGCRLCYEVWKYDNYADGHFFHKMYMSKSAAYKEVRRVKKQHDGEYSDRWNYRWILELTIRDHNKRMKELNMPYQIIEVPK